MPEKTLPEEILREILSYLFVTTPEVFCGFPSRYHPPLPLRNGGKARDKDRPHDLLLVSKRWLRVATPLLYQSISIRTSAHAQAVATLIRANPNLGRAVRHLKLLGGYGRDLFTIAKAAPNVETLYLYISVKSSESVTGIKKALPLMNPTRLYLEDRPPHQNKKVDELHKALTESMANWTSLVSRVGHTLVSLTPCRQKFVQYNPRYYFKEPMMTALKGASNIEELWLDGITVLSMLGDRSLISVVESSKNLKIHSLGKNFEDEIIDLMRELDYPEAIRKAFVFDDYPHAPATAHVPMGYVRPRLTAVMV